MINADHICEGCPAQLWGERRVEADGSGSSGIMVVGESLWHDEVHYGQNFAGAAGAMLERCLRRIAMERQQLIVTNSAWCRIKHLGFFDKLAGVSAAVMDHCRPHLDQLIEERQPKVIVTLGAVAMRRVLGLSGLGNHHGYVHDSAYGIPVIPSFHPSFIMQGQQRYQSVLIFALRRAQEVAYGTWSRRPVSYVLDDYAGMRRYLEQELPLIDMDIETPKSAKLDEETVEDEEESYTIIRASLSHTPGTACTFPWIEPFISLAKKAVERALIVVMHNRFFDQPRLEAQDWHFQTVHDSMWEWHFLQSDLPKALGFVAPFFADIAAWKHLNDAQPDWYSAVDADAGLRVYLGVKRELERQGRWQRWLRHCVDAGKVFDRMGARGILLDRSQQQALKAKLVEEYDAAYDRLQQEIPAAVLPVKVYRTGKQGGREVVVPCSCISDVNAQGGPN